MSISTTTKSYPPSELMVWGEEEPVEIQQVESSLTGLWRAASGDQQDRGEGALALARLWNLVGFHTRPAGISGQEDDGARRIDELLEQVTLTVPARVIHLEQWAAEDSPSEGKEVEARTSTHCLQSAGGGRMVCCEAIHLTGFGDRGRSHFPALVRALLVSHLPVALLWLDDVPRRSRLLGHLLGMSDRLIVDSQHTTDPESLPAVYDLMRSAGEMVVDLGWQRLNPLRNLVAGCFDLPERVEQLRNMEGILIETSPKGINTGLMMAGWILSRLGFGQAEAVDLGSGATTWRWKVSKGGGTFPLDFSTREGYGGLDEIYRIEIRAGGGTFEWRDVDPEHMSVKSPDREVPSVALREANDAELVASALGGSPADPIFSEALAMAARLVDIQQWNP